MKISQIYDNPNNPKRCVISLGVGKPSFVKSIKRLEESLNRIKFRGDFLYWDENLPTGCPPHFEAPFAFKTYCFYSAKKHGYDQILWMDSTTIALRPLEPIFEDIQRRGYAFFNNNYDQSLGQWISDEALLKNGLTRDEALAIPELPCSVMGLNMKSELATNFLDQWHQIMADGITAKGTSRKIQTWDDYQNIFWNKDNCISVDKRVKGHRCDQPAAGIVAHRLGMVPYGDELRDIHYKTKPIKRNTAILHHREFGTSIKSLDQIYHEVFFQIPFVETPIRKLRSLKRRLNPLSTQQAE